MTQTVPLCPDHRHQIVAPRHPFGQFHPFRWGGRGRLQLQRPAHPRQHFRIDPVGFGPVGFSQLAGRAGIFPGVARVDAGKVGFEPGQRLGQGAVLRRTPRRLQGWDSGEVAVSIRRRVRAHTPGAHLRTAHPKVRTQKKHLTPGDRCRGEREGCGESARNGWRAGRSGERGRSPQRETLDLQTKSGDPAVKQHATWGRLEPVTCPDVDTPMRCFAAGRGFYLIFRGFTAQSARGENAACGQKLPRWR